jgi:hypothetical protein
VHTGDDRFLVEGQRVPAGQFDFDMRAVRFRDLKAQESIEGERP